MVLGRGGGDNSCLCLLQLYYYLYLGLAVCAGSCVEGHEVRQYSLPLVETVVLLTSQPTHQKTQQPATLHTMLAEREREGEGSRGRQYLCYVSTCVLELCSRV